jgi:CheY-like chemotaxis protein
VTENETFGSDELTVVVVDDDPDSCEVICAILESRTCRTVPFLEGRDAVLYALHRPFDVAVLDLRLDGMDGASVAQAMRSYGLRRHAALIALSGVVDPEWRLVRHFDAYLRKPVDPRLLRRLVRSLASSAREQVHEEEASR